jgi:hypothetical protein
MPSQQAQIEDSLAREMAKLKIQDERKRKEVERICAQSDELKELQKRITAAYQNKERAAQITEKQYRQQVQLVSLIFLTLMKLFAFAVFRSKTPKSTRSCCAPKKSKTRFSVRPKRLASKTVSRTNTKFKNRLKSTKKLKLRPKLST